MVKTKTTEILEQISEYSILYAQMRLYAELQVHNISKIRNSLEFEISIYEEIPQLLLRNYKSVDHFLDYILEVEKYDRHKTPNTTTDF